MVRSRFWLFAVFLWVTEFGPALASSAAIWRGAAFELGRVRRIV
jgi:hypothetical protein